MLSKILPEKIFNIIDKKVNLKAVNEIRFRADKPIVICVSGKNYFLNENGITSSGASCLYASKIAIEDIIFRASECSIYSVNEQIKKGYIVTENGIRIGIGGNVVEENGQVKTMTNFSSCNIRLPHNVRNCSLCAFPFIVNENVIENTLIISPPGCGKTTFLRDFVAQLSERKLSFNVLILDERGELDCKLDSNFYDKIAFSSKKMGFENGIRALSPDLIVTDEVGQEEDIDAILYASTCGVKVLASTHADSMETFCKKPLFQKLIKKRSLKDMFCFQNEMDLELLKAFTMKILLVCLPNIKDKGESEWDMFWLWFCFVFACLLVIIIFQNLISGKSFFQQLLCLRKSFQLKSTFQEKDLKFWLKILTL